MADETVVHNEDPYAYLKAAIITLGVAAGIAVVALWGDFSAPVRIVLSLALFPVVLGIAFFAVFLAVSLLRSRYSSVEGIIALVLIAIILLLFPLIYVPDAPLAMQIQRLSIIPISIAIAIVIGYFVVQWMEQHPSPRQARYRGAEGG
jgi:hypothetical protein